MPHPLAACKHTMHHNLCNLHGLGQSAISLACSQSPCLFGHSRPLHVPAQGSSLLDRYGQCCQSGVLDACGVCGGSASVVDVQGVCCASGSLDASGYCCMSGTLDECGVCDGDGSSCALHAVVEVQVRGCACVKGRAWFSGWVFRQGF